MAVKLGIVNVDRMLDPRRGGLTAKQLKAWEHYAELEPFDETRADWRAASIVTMIANVNRDPKKKGYAMKDLVLKFNDEPVKRTQTWQDQDAMLRVIAAQSALFARNK